MAPSANSAASGGPAASPAAHSRGPHSHSQSVTDETSSSSGAAAAAAIFRPPSPRRFRFRSAFAPAPSPCFPPRDGTQAQSERVAEVKRWRRRRRHGGAGHHRPALRAGAGALRALRGREPRELAPGLSPAVPERHRVRIQPPPGAPDPPGLLRLLWGLRALPAGAAPEHGRVRPPRQPVPALRPECHPECHPWGHCHGHTQCHPQGQPQCHLRRESLELKPIQECRESFRTFQNLLPNPLEKEPWDVRPDPQFPADSWAFIPKIGGRN